MKPSVFMRVFSMLLALIAFILVFVGLTGRPPWPVRRPVLNVSQPVSVTAYLDTDAPQRKSPRVLDQLLSASIPVASFESAVQGANWSAGSEPTKGPYLLVRLTFDGKPDQFIAVSSRDEWFSGLGDAGHWQPRDSEAWRMVFRRLEDRLIETARE